MPVIGQDPETAMRMIERVAVTVAPCGHHDRSLERRARVDHRISLVTCVPVADEQKAPAHRLADRHEEGRIFLLVEGDVRLGRRADADAPCTRKGRSWSLSST